MATRQIKVVISVQDGATKQMRRVERQFRKTSDTVQKFDKRLVNFNRTLFSTTAVVGTLAGAFYGMGRAISKGADFERAEKSFQRVFGPNADILKMLGKFTNVAVDEVTAMNSAIRLSMNDIGLGTQGIAETLAMGAVAAKKANVDTAEGVRLVTEAIRTANLESLDRLNIINRGSTAYKAYEAALSKAAGTMGTAAIALKRKHEFLKLLRRSTREYMFSTLDLKDAITKLGNFTTRLTARMGEFLGKALGPFIGKMANAAENAAEFFKRIKEDKKLVELTRRIILTAGAVAGLVSVLATLKLVTAGLLLVGTGIPGLIAITAAGVMAFAGFEKAVSGALKGLKLFGSFIRGLFQLVTNFDPTTGFSKIDESIVRAMDSIGLLKAEFDDKGKIVGVDGFLFQVARGFIFIKNVAIGVKEGLQEVFTVMKKVISPIIDSFKELLNMEAGPWAASWLDTAKSIGKAFGWLIPIVVGFKALKGIKGIIGGVFGGGRKGGRGPAGTITDPIYTASVGGAVGGLLGGRKGRGFFGIPKMFGKLFGRMNNKLGKAIGILNFRVLGAVIKDVAGGLGTVGKMIWRGKWRMLPKALGSLVGRFRLLGPALRGAIVPALKMGGALAVAAGAGFLIGKALMELFPQLKKLGQNLFELIHGTAEEQIEKGTQERDIFNLLNERREKRGEEPLSFEAFQERRKQQTSTGPGKKSTVTNPVVMSDQVGAATDLIGQIEQLKGSERKQAVAAYNEARLEESPGGKGITRDEFDEVTKIIRGFSAALDKSDMARNIETMTNNTKTNNTRSRRMP